MNVYVYPSRQERAISVAGAFGMHLLFLALLVFGVNWQKKIEPQVNSVDLWANLPPQAQPKVVPPPPPPPEPEVKPVVKPVEPPPVKVAPKPEVAKPDIALKEKAEKQRRLLEEKEKQKAASKREEEAKTAQKQQQAKEAEAQRLAKEQEDERRRIAEQQAAAQAKLRNDYIQRIRARIKNFVVLPPNIQGNPEAEFDVILLPGGEVLSAKLKHASGSAAYDNAVERAILKAQPLPLPPDPALFKDFRELNLKFRPQE